jgi:ABC-type transport system substrate-binding protein
LAGYWQKVGLKPKIRILDYGRWIKAWNERRTQNTIAGGIDALAPDVYGLIGKFEDRLYFGNMRSSANIPELNERFERIRKSLDIGEISKLMVEIYRYAYDHYLLIPICEIPDKIATTKRIPKWDPGLRRFDRNYYDLIRQR